MPRSRDFLRRRRQGRTGACRRCSKAVSRDQGRGLRQMGRLFRRTPTPPTSAARPAHRSETGAIVRPRRRSRRRPAVSYDLFALSQRAVRRAIFPYRRNGYVFDQMNGAQTEFPAFLINIHTVDERAADARPTSRRIRGIGPLHRPGDRQVGEREKLGVLPPKWVFPQVIATSTATSSAGAPFDAGTGQ